MTNHDSSGGTIYGLGEILWDCLPNERQLGGAPGNFAWHCVRLGLRADVISSLGDDPLGREALSILRAGGLACDTVGIDPAHPTGSVQVRLEAGGKAVYEFLADTAWDNPVWSDRLGERLAEASCVCFGTLAQRSEAGAGFVRRCLRETPSKALKIFDINLRQKFFSAAVLRDGAECAEILKLSDEELPAALTLLGLPVEGDQDAQLLELTKAFSLQAVALTCGSEGAALAAQGKIFREKAPVITVRDTIGAGDSFTAVLACGCLRGLDWQECLSAAVRYAGLVCTVSGGMPLLPPERIRQAAGNRILGE